jgi:K+-sensing histidine kinase KdpD
MKAFVIRHVWLKRAITLIMASVAILIVTNAALKLSSLASVATADFCFLVVVLLTAFLGDLLVAIVVSLVATVCYDYFFIAPIGTLMIAAIPDVIALAAFLLTSVIISYLAAAAAENASKVKNFNKVLDELKAFGNWLASVPDDQITLTLIARKALDVFGLEYCSVRAYGDNKWSHFTGTAVPDISNEVEKESAPALQDHPTDLMELSSESVLGVQYGQINAGSRLRALLVLKSGTLPYSVVTAIAHMISLRLLQASPARESRP